jgi:hypothetical protein
MREEGNELGLVTAKILFEEYPMSWALRNVDGWPWFQDCGHVTVSIFLNNPKQSLPCVHIKDHRRNEKHHKNHELYYHFYCLSPSI